MIDRFKHFFEMIKIHGKGYSLLSISVILSLTVLLTTLLMLDSISFNENKEIFRTPKTALQITKNDMTVSDFGLLQEKIYKEKNYTYFSGYNLGLPSFSTKKNEVNANYYFVNKNYFDFYTFSGTYFDKPICVYGNCEIEKEGEIVIDELFFRLLGFEDFSPTILTLPIRHEKEVVFKDFLVTGVVRVGDEKNRLHKFEGKKDVVFPNVYFDYKLIAKSDESANYNGYLLFSDNSREIAKFAKNFGMSVITSLELHELANEYLYNFVIVKEVLIIILFVVLGLNIYGSFMNALRERYLEIGVKRAIGVSKQNIMVQFFCEIFFVLVINFVVSTLLALIIVTFYKFFVLICYVEEFVIYMNFYSLLNYFIFSFFISILCCFVFSYKASQIPIIDILKNE